MKHKHYDLIVAWANGAKIQELHRWNNKWVDIGVGGAAILWSLQSDYRIKPKEPIVIMKSVMAWKFADGTTPVEWSHMGVPNVKFTFDPDTMKLLAVEKI